MKNLIFFQAFIASNQDSWKEAEYAGTNCEKDCEPWLGLDILPHSQRKINPFATGMPLGDWKRAR